MSWRVGQGSLNHNVPFIWENQSHSLSQKVEIIEEDVYRKGLKNNLSKGFGEIIVPMEIFICI